MHNLSLISIYCNNHEQYSADFEGHLHSSLIKNDDYWQKIKSLITEIVNLEELTTPVEKWEFLKYKICQFTISFSKKIKKELEKNELDIVKQLNVYCNKLNPTEDDKQKIQNFQPKLDQSGEVSPHIYCFRCIGLGSMGPQEQ